MVEKDSPNENNLVSQRNEAAQQQTYCEFMSTFWGRQLENKLHLRHDPEGHEWRAVDRDSGTLLRGIVAADHYSEQLHTRVLELATERGLEVTCIESTDSMVHMLLELTAYAKQTEAELGIPPKDAE